eukprot:m.1565671 g.1565671  ORF g.1565671 m.1565671 type:complete len:537 (-) comp25288_c1_seq10:3356-4966(-)
MCRNYAQSVHIWGYLLWCIVPACLALERSTVVPFPKVIHFICDSPNQTAMSLRQHKCLASWKKYNPDHAVRFWDDKTVEDFVRDQFPNEVALYHGLTEVERKHLLRYMIMFKNGGVYADLDVECYRQVNSWYPNLHENGFVVVGIEADVTAVGEKDYDLIRPQQLAPWVFAGPKGHDVFDCAIKRIGLRYRQFNVAAPRKLWDARASQQLAGAGVFTDCVQQYLSSAGGLPFARMRSMSSAKVSDVVILHTDAFAPFQPHSGGTVPDGYSELYDLPDYMLQYIDDLGILVRRWAGGSTEASRISMSSMVTASRTPVRAEVFRPWPWQHTLFTSRKYPVVQCMAVAGFVLGTVMALWLWASLRLDTWPTRTGGRLFPSKFGWKKVAVFAVWLLGILCVWEIATSILDYQRLRKTNDHIVAWYHETLEVQAPQASFVFMSVPSTIAAGEPIKVRIEFHNSGKSIWYVNKGYRVKAFGKHAHMLLENNKLLSDSERCDWWRGCGCGPKYNGCVRVLFVATRVSSGRRKHSHAVAFPMGG